MKQRVITGLIWGMVAILNLVFLYSPMMGIFISVFSVIAVHEIEKVAKVKNIPVIVISMIFAGIVPFVNEYHLLTLFKFHIPLAVILVLYIFILLVLMLAFYEKTKFEHIAIVVFSSIAVPYGLSTFTLVRDVYKTFPQTFQQQSKGFYLFFLGLVCAWITDMFAYFVGSKFGRHKMAPLISPKKSIEGAIGGILGTVIFNMITLLIFNRFFFDTPIMSYWMLIPVSMVLSVMGMLGDLSASVIKRNYGEKDFGTIMKGHGGIMDRFDSCLFVMPSIYAFVLFTQAIK